MANSWFPGSESSQIEWLNNYALKIALRGAGVGLSAAEITKTVKGLTSYAFVLSTLNPVFQNDAQKSTAYKKWLATGSGPTQPYPEGSAFPAAPPEADEGGVLNLLFNQVARIKLHPGMTPELEQELSLVGPGPGSIDVTNISPVLRVLVTGSAVSIPWKWGAWPSSRCRSEGPALPGNLSKPRQIFHWLKIIMPKKMVNRF